MKSLSLKLNDELFYKLESVRENLNEARNRFISEAIEYYLEKKENEIIKKQIHKESYMIRKESEKLVKKFENCDGIDGDEKWNF